MTSAVFWKMSVLWRIDAVCHVKNNGCTTRTTNFVTTGIKMAVRMPECISLIGCIAPPRGWANTAIFEKWMNLFLCLLVKGCSHLNFTVTPSTSILGCVATVGVASFVMSLPSICCLYAKHVELPSLLSLLSLLSLHGIHWRHCYHCRHCCHWDTAITAITGDIAIIGDTAITRATLIIIYDVIKGEVTWRTNTRVFISEKSECMLLRLC